MRPTRPTVLVVDQPSDATRQLVTFLRERELHVVWAHDGEGAFHVLDEEPVDCLVTELAMHRLDGMAVLERARKRNPELCAVVAAESAGVEIAVEAMRQGAYDFQIKPLHRERLLAVLQRGLAHQQLVSRLAEVEATLDRRFGPDRLIGGSRALARVLDQVRHLASSHATVLVEGEPGAGKGLVARAIHHHGPRKHERFVWAHCGALGEPMIERELFGDEPGPAAGDPNLMRGRFELADGGTLLLEEVAEATPALQEKLFHVLRDRTFERVGGGEPVRVDVRLIATTERNLENEVAAGRFRRDFYERLSVVRVAMPPLRERREDISLLVQTFLDEFNRTRGRRVSGVTPGLLDRLVQHDWPGNVRELKNTVEGMVAFAEGKRPLDVSDLPLALRGGDELRVAVGMTVEEMERELIVATLRHTGHDKTRAAAMLGIGLRTLYRKIDRHGIR